MIKVYKTIDNVLERNPTLKGRKDFKEVVNEGVVYNFNVGDLIDKATDYSGFNGYTRKPGNRLKLMISRLNGISIYCGELLNHANKLWFYADTQGEKNRINKGIIKIERANKKLEKEVGEIEELYGIVKAYHKKDDFDSNGGAVKFRTVCGVFPIGAGGSIGNPEKKLEERGYRRVDGKGLIKIRNFKDN